MLTEDNFTDLTLNRGDRWDYDVHSGWCPRGRQLAFDAVLYALHEGARGRAGNIDPLFSLFQSQAETALFLFRPVIGALQLEQVYESHANALAIALGAYHLRGVL